MSRYENLNTVIQEGIVAVIRAPSSELLADVAEALLAGGITVMEITFTVPQATQVLQEMVNRVGDRALVGAGTILDPETAPHCPAPRCPVPGLTGNQPRRHPDGPSL